MKYALLIYVPEPPADVSQADREAVTQEYMTLAEDPRSLDGAGLEPPHTATTVRVQDGSTLTTDGPFADTKEFFGGYYVVEADDLDGAIDFASRIPAARFGGAVEIRPVLGQ